MRVVLIDPFYEPRPYSQCLAGALKQAGCSVTTRVGARAPLSRCDAVSVGSSSWAHELFPRHQSLLATIPVKGRQCSHLVRQLARHLRKNHADIVHFQHPAIPLLDSSLLALVRKTAPLVLTVSDTVRLSSARMPALRWRSFRKLICRVDHIVTHTNVTSRRLIELGVDSERIDIVPYGRLDCAPGPAESAALCPQPERPEALIGTSPKTVVVRGTGRPDAGIDSLIRAVRHMPETARGSCRFVVTGTTRGCATTLQDLCRELCVEHLFRFNARTLSDPAAGALLDSAAVVVFPRAAQASLDDIMTALSHGKPVIGERSELFRELVENGVHGFLTARDDIRELADALTRLVDNDRLRDSMSANVRGLIERQPSWENLAATTLRCYQAASESRRRSLQQSSCTINTCLPLWRLSQ